MSVPQKPEPFLTVRGHDLSLDPSVSGLCVGYERGEWRASQFARHILHWLPEFALTYSELQDMHSGNAMRMIAAAARKIYESKKYTGRGEFGELFLHAAIRQVFNSVPAISKIYYKSATNDTVKGFDAVHVVGEADRLELWLGEAKFYTDINRAIDDVVAEIDLHMQSDYLRGEFMLIKGKVDPHWSHAAVFNSLLSENKSLDEIFKKACLAVLLTYDSDCLTQHVECSDAYIAAFETEIRRHYKRFAEKKLPKDIDIHLFLLPLNTKEILIRCLDEKLKAWQSL